MEHNWQEYINFNLQTVDFLLNVKNVLEVMPFTEPTPVPGSPAGVTGILSIRGEIIPVLSGCQLLFGEPWNPDLAESREPAEHIIVVESNDEKIGIHVDGVGEVQALDSSHIEQCQDESIRHDSLSGIIHDHDRVKLVIDTQLLPS